MNCKIIAVAVVVLIHSAAAFCFADDGLKYRVKLEGLHSASLRRELLADADTVRLRKSRPRSVLQLERRIRRDTRRFNDLLRSKGYYSADINSSIYPGFRRHRVVFYVRKGPRFLINDVAVVAVDDYAGKVSVDSNLSGLRSGDPAVNAAIQRGTQLIADHFQQQGHPFASAYVKEVVVDHSLRQVDVLYVFETGQAAAFGEWSISGLETVRSEFVKARKLWREGEPYNVALVSATRRLLADSGLFSVLRFSHAEEADADGALPLQLDVRERAHRSVALGTGYHSDDGLRASVAWEHRNLRGGGEQLLCGVQVTEYSYGVDSRLRVPGLERPNRFVTIRLQAAVEKPDAFESRNVALQALLETVIGRRWTFGRGAGVKYADVIDDSGKENYNLLYIPLLFDRSKVHDPLDPRSGYRWFFNTAPYVDTLDTSTVFVKSRVGFTQYRRILRRPSITGAARVTAGSIVGASHSVIPADERFFAGGGGSVRGYSYQSVGPLFDNGKPRGGRSFGLLSGELRWRIGGNWGAVVFVDGGMVDLDTVPFAGGDFYRGAGGGMRYFTPIGPLRADVAVPLDKRAGIDDSYQIYVSLGQAF